MDQQFLWAKPRNRQQQLTRNIKCVKVLQLTTFSFDSNNLRDCFQTKPFFFQLCKLCSPAWTSSGIVSVESDSHIFLIWTESWITRKETLLPVLQVVLTRLWHVFGWFVQACGNEFLHRDGYGYEWWLAGSFNRCWPQVVYAVVMHIQKYSHGNKHCPLMLPLNILGFVVKCSNYQGSPETIQIHRAEKAECQAIVAAQSCHEH
jgi:hypothetical protein